MATKFKGTEPNRPGAAFPLDVDRSQAPQGDAAGVAPDAPQETRDVAQGNDPRRTEPRAPTGLVGASSRDAVARVKLVMQQAFVQAKQGHPSAWEAGARAARLVQTTNMHPLVASYKAEAVEYLEFKAGEVASLAENEKAEAVAASKAASEEQRP